MGKLDIILHKDNNVFSFIFYTQVLRFYGFFKQTVNESPAEYYRVRPVHIFYYLEDDSISVVEPHVENSGMPQGLYISITNTTMICVFLNASS